MVLVYKLGYFFFIPLISHKETAEPKISKVKYTIVMKSGKPFRAMLDILRIAITVKNINKLHNEINRIGFTKAPIIQKIINPK